MRARVEILILMLCCFAQCYGQGTLQITFDGPPVVGSGAAIGVQQYSESGMLFKPIGFNSGRVGINPTGGRPDDGTAYLQAAITQSLMFSRVNGSLFSLISVDLAEYSTFFQSPLTVHFVGYKLDGSTITTDLITDGIIDGTGSLTDFQMFYFDKEWAELTRVEIPTSLWSLDNLVVSIPEPTSGILLAIGGLTLVALKLRNRRRE